MADLCSIRYFDEATDAVTLIAGHWASGSEDGIGSNARFEGINSMIVASDGLTIWCGDEFGMRRIRTATHEVTTFGVDGMVFRYTHSAAAAAADDDDDDDDDARKDVHCVCTRQAAVNF